MRTVFHEKFMMINVTDIQQAWKKWKNMAAFIHRTPLADDADVVWTPIMRVAGERDLTTVDIPAISPCHSTSVAAMAYAGKPQSIKV